MRSVRLVTPSGAFHRVAVCLCLAASLAVCSHALGTPDDDKDLKDALHQNLQDYLTSRSSIEHISTLSMSITFRGSKEGITDAIGTTEYGGGKPVTPESLFQIGSNTKAFTSVLILRLEAEGVLRIEDTVGKWLPQYPAWGKVKIRELLDMTSGIPTYDLTPAQIDDYGSNPYIKSTPEDLVAYVYPTIKTPGAMYEYSNTNYILLQMIIEKAGWSHSYKAEVDRLIEESHLHDTYYEPYFYPTFVTRRLVSGYYVNTDEPVIPNLLGTDTKNYSLGWTQAAGGLISKPTDLTRWIRELFEGDILPPQQKKELEKLVSIPDGVKIPNTSEKYPQAFGLGVSQMTAQPFGVFWFYNGSTIGYRAAYLYLPASGLIISVFTNSQAATAVSEVDRVLMATLYETLKRFGRV